MPEETFQEKTEPATPKKREDTRKKGKVAKSAELNSAFILVFGLLILLFGGTALAAKLAMIAQTAFANASAFHVSAVSAHRTMVEGIGTLGVLLAPVVGGLMLVGLAASYAQVGFLFTLEPLQPRWEKLNPITGIQKLFASRRSLVEMLKNLLKVGIVALIAYFSLDGMMEESLTVMAGDIESILAFMGEASVSLGLKMGLAFLVLAVFDMLFQRYEFDRELRMTKQEVKEEGKELEGDPKIKGRIRTIQRQIAYKRMMHEVPKASVVVTNPTHVAVALKYDAAKMSAPKVVAKGAELIAGRIKELALAHSVPIVEDPPLAQALYKAVDIGDEIPEKLFQAVAQLLAHIYRLKNFRAGFSIN